MLVFLACMRTCVFSPNVYLLLLGSLVHAAEKIVVTQKKPAMINEGGPETDGQTDRPTDGQTERVRAEKTSRAQVTDLGPPFVSIPPLSISFVHPLGGRMGRDENAEVNALFQGCPPKKRGGSIQRCDCTQIS